LKKPQRIYEIWSIIFVATAGNRIKIKKVKKFVKKFVEKFSKSFKEVFENMSKSCQICQNIVQKLFKSCQKFLTPGKNQQTDNGVIVEKVQWCNSKKVNGPEKNKKKNIIGIP
jgi:ribosomal protein S17E